MNKNRTQQQLYIIFWIIIVILIGLISWFTYLLIQPDDKTAATNTNTNTTVTTNADDTTTDKKAKKKKTTNSTQVTETNSNTKAEDATDTTTTTDNDIGGLVEPADSTEDDASDAEADTTTDEESTDEDVAADEAEGDKTVTLYFPKSASSCGEVYPVERRITESDDPYGQIILEVMDGPATEESGYTTAVPADLYLRQVQYTADGALITVSEAYDSLDSCNQRTVDSQLIETANAMFELPEGTAGEVVVGTVSDDAEETTTDSADGSDEE